MNKEIILKDLKVQLDRFKDQKFTCDQNFWELFHQHQNIIDNETLECLILINRSYEKVFDLAKQGNLEESIIQLKRANNLKNKFEFNADADAIFKIISYPNIAFLKYKLKKIRSAKYYTKRTINLIRLKWNYYIRPDTKLREYFC